MQRRLAAKFFNIVAESDNCELTQIKTVFRANDAKLRWRRSMSEYPIRHSSRLFRIFARRSGAYGRA
jgi:hypothetical protein